MYKRQILSHDGPLLLDLDETLYLSNSTEDFIDSARPRLLALLLMRLLDAIGPWRWTGGEATRDVWRVRLISICFPWTKYRWKKRVGELAEKFANLRLIAALKSAGRPRRTPVIATVGFHPIVAPLVAALGLPQARIVAARLSTFADRRDGKLHLALGALGDDWVRCALVLTDSINDLTPVSYTHLPRRVPQHPALHPLVHAGHDARHGPCSRASNIGCGGAGAVRALRPVSYTHLRPYAAFRTAPRRLR